MNETETIRAEVDKVLLNVALAQVQQLQSHFWKALRILEWKLGCELDSTEDFTEFDVNALLEYKRQVGQ